MPPNYSPQPGAPGAMRDPEEAVRAAPARLALLNSMVGLAAAGALAALHARSGEKGPLLAALVIAAITPLDAAVLYGILKSHSDTLLKALSIIRRHAPSTATAPLGLKLVASWWKSGEVVVIHYSTRGVTAARAANTERPGGNKRQLPPYYQPQGPRG